MIGQNALGLVITYLIGAVMLGISFLLGKYWNRKLPPTLIKEEGWSNRAIARIAILAAVAAAGGMITVPGPATSIRLDSMAGYFGALMFGWEVGAMIAMFGTFFSNLMSGFSSWVPMVPYYMINMAFAAIAFGLTFKLFKRYGFVLSLIVGTFVNTLCILPWIIMLGWGMMVSILIPQIVASLANVLLAAIAYTAISAAQKRRRVDAPTDLDDDEDEEEDKKA